MSMGIPGHADAPCELDAARKQSLVLVTPFLPHSGVRHAGGRLCWHLLSVLSARFSVHLVSRVTAEERRHTDEVARLVGSMDLVDAPTPVERRTPIRLVAILVSYVRLARMARRVTLRERARMVQIEFSETGFFWRAPAGVRTSLTCHDVLAKPAVRRAEGARGVTGIVAGMRARLVSTLERRLVERVDKVFVLSDVDRRWVLGLSPRAPVAVLEYPAGIGFAGLPRDPITARVLFVGALNRQENVEAVAWFIETCWTSVRHAVPHACFHIVGAGASAQRVAEWSRVSGVTVVGTVADVEPHYAQAAVFVAPILVGGGVIVKVLDALAAGVPVVTTSRGNEGICAPDPDALRVADSPQAFAAAVIELLVEPAVAEQMGAQGRRHVAGRTDARFAALIEAHLGPPVRPDV